MLANELVSAVAVEGTGSQWGGTALLGGAYGGHVTALGLLLDCGAELEAKDNVRSYSHCPGSWSRHGSPRKADTTRAAVAGCEVRARVRACEVCVGEEGGSKGVGVAACKRALAIGGKHSVSWVSGAMFAQWGCTPLMQTAFRGHVEALELLLDRGGDIEAKDKVCPHVLCPRSSIGSDVARPWIMTSSGLPVHGLRAKVPMHRSTCWSGVSRRCGEAAVAQHVWKASAAVSEPDARCSGWPERRDQLGAPWVRCVCASGLAEWQHGSDDGGFKRPR